MAGAPTLYKPEYPEQIRKLCLLGATNVELADFFGVANSTYEKWVRKYPEVREAMRLGKMLANATVAESLYKRATGYSHPEIDIRVVKGEIVKTEIVKHYAPDTTACIFFLKNRDKANWRDRQEIDHSGHMNYTQLTPEELDREIARLAERTKGG
jgi:hypothetical protein